MAVAEREPTYGLTMKRAIALVLLLAVMAGSLGLLTASSGDKAPRDFRIGVWYEVVVNRNGASKPLQGLLVKTDRDWFVLATISVGANDVETGNSLLTWIPYIGKWFSHTQRVEVICRDYRWIPRANARIVNRNENVDPRVRAELEPHSQMLDEYFDVYFAIDGEPSPIGVHNDFAT